MADDRFTDPDDDDFANKYKVMAYDRFTAPTDPDDDFANKYIERREMHYELNSPAINLMRRDGILFFENDKSKGRVPFQPDDLGGEFFAPPDFISGVQGEAWTVPGKGSLRDLDLAIPYLATGKKLEQPGGRPSYVWDEDQKTISEEEWAKTQAERWPDEPIADEENNYIFDGDFFNLLVNGPKDTTLTRQTRQEKTAAELGGIEADPAIDPLMAASGAYGAAWRLVAGKIIPRAVTSFAAAVAAAVTDPVVGTTMEAAENIHPLLGLPVAMAVGMYFGKKLEQPVEDFVAGLMKKAGTFNPKDLTRAVKDFNKALGPEGSSVGGSIAPDIIGKKIKLAKGKDAEIPENLAKLPLKGTSDNLVNVEPLPVGKGDINTYEVESKENQFGLPMFNAKGTEVRPKFGENLTEESTKLYNFYGKNRGKYAIHVNSKTGMSMDFSTNCPNRANPLKGPCPYCYVEHGRLNEEIFGMKGNNKAVGETPYNGEIQQFKVDMVDELNRDGGLRVFSFGDYRPDEDFEGMTKALADAQEKGLMLKAITKEPELVRQFGDHPNLRVNLSTDNVPADISQNAISIEDALKLKAGRENIKIRAVALTEKEALMFDKDPRIDVTTLYHGMTNFQTGKWGAIGKSRDLHKEMMAVYSEGGITAAKKAFPDYKLTYVPKKKLKEAEVKKGLNFRVDMHEELPLDEKTGLYRHNKLMQIIEVQNPELIKQAGRERVQEYTDTWENLFAGGAPKKGLLEKLSKKGGICCDPGEFGGAGKCSKHKGKCGFGYASMLIPGVFLVEDDKDEL